MMTDECDDDVDDTAADEVTAVMLIIGYDDGSDGCDDVSEEAGRFSSFNDTRTSKSKS